MHRGSNEVGGNCVEVRTTTTRIIIDVGMPLFGENRQPHDLGKLKRLSADELRSNGILLEIPGLFELDRSRDETQTVAVIDAILLSHAHQDHTGLLPFTRPEIPVYGTSGTSKMMLAGSIFANQVSVPRDRYRTLEKDGKIRIGDIEITPIAVDHSIYGSVAFLLEADGKRVLYSGDLRMHGRKPGMMKRFAEIAKTADEIVLEGTHFGLPNGECISEFEVENRMADNFQNARSLVLVSVSAQNLDRLVGIIRASIRSNRQLVLDFYSAFVLYLLGSETNLPTMGVSPKLRLFISSRLKSKLSRGVLAKLRARWKVCEIGVDEVRKNPGQFVLIFQQSMLESDFECTLPANSLLIYSRWDGYRKLDQFKPMESAINACDGSIQAIHTSGHLFDFDCRRLIDQLTRSKIVPIHTFEPDQLRKLSIGARSMT